MSANWKEVEELFANAERMRYHWRDADPDSEQIARQLQEILTRVAATATEQRDNIGRRNARFRSFGMDLSDEQRQQYKDAAIKDEYVNDALDKTNRQLAAITSEDALDAEIRRHHSPAAAERARFAKAPARHDWSDLLQTIGSFLATWKLKNLHKFVKHHAKNMEQDVVRLMMTQDPDKKITTTALIFKALDIDKALRTIQNISGMSADAIYEACPGLSRAVPEPPEPILRNQCFEDRIRYLLETQKHMRALKEQMEALSAIRPQARGDMRQKIHEKVKLMERILAGKLSKRPRRPGTDYSTTTLSPIAARALRTILHELTLLETTTRSPMELERVQSWSEPKRGVAFVLKELSKLKLPEDIKEQIEILQNAIQRRVAAAKKGGRRTRRRRKNKRRRTRQKRRHKRRKSRRRRKRRYSRR